MPRALLRRVVRHWGPLVLALLLMCAACYMGAALLEFCCPLVTRG